MGANSKRIVFALYQQIELDQRRADAVYRALGQAQATRQIGNCQSRLGVGHKIQNGSASGQGGNELELPCLRFFQVGQYSLP